MRQKPQESSRIGRVALFSMATSNSKFLEVRRCLVFLWHGTGFKHGYAMSIEFRLVLDGHQRWVPHVLIAWR